MGNWGELGNFLYYHLVTLTANHFLGIVSLNLALAWFLPVAVVALHFGDLYAVSWDECP